MSASDDAAQALSIASVHIGQDAVDAAKPTDERLPRIAPVEITAACSPASVRVGIDCGMPDMCGMNPCLCGTPDAYGACACNGTKKVAAKVTYKSSSSEVVTVEQAFGKTWLVPHGAGEATVTVTGKLAHHRTATCEIPVTVGGPTAADAGLAGACLLALAVVAGVVALVRRRVRSARRKSKRNRSLVLLPVLALCGAIAAAGLSGCVSSQGVTVDASSPKLQAASLSAASDTSDPESTQRISIVLVGKEKLAAQGSAEDIASDFNVELNGKSLDENAVKLSAKVKGKKVILMLAPADDAKDGPGSSSSFFAVYQAQFRVAAARDDGGLPHIARAGGSSCAVLKKTVKGTLPSGAAIEVVSSRDGSSTDDVAASATFKVTSPATVRAVTWFSPDGGSTKILKHNHQFAQADCADYAAALAEAIADADGSAYSARAQGDTVTVRANVVHDGEHLDPVIVEGFDVSGGTFSVSDAKAAS